MNELLVELARIALQLRYVGYSVLLVCGLVLSLVAFGRAKNLCNGRRKLYHVLTSITLSLAWIGGVGWMGLVGYGDRPAPASVIIIAFSMGIVWLAVSLLAVTILIMKEEIQHNKVDSAPTNKAEWV